MTITALESMPITEIAALLATLTEERNAARRMIEDAETAIRDAGIIAPGTLTDRIRALAAFHRAAEEASNASEEERQLLLAEIHNLRAVLRETLGAFERFASMDRP